MIGRPHDLTFWLYTGLPFGINAALTAFYQSGGPYTPLIFAGKDPQVDAKNPNSKRGPAFRNVNLNFNKYVSIMDHRISIGLSVYNLFDIRNEIDIYPLTGKAGDLVRITQIELVLQTLSTTFLAHTTIGHGVFLNLERLTLM